MTVEPTIVALTGESGCGKTTLCTRVIALARLRGLKVAGVLTPPRYAGGRKVGLDVEEVSTGQRRPLAEAWAEPCRNVPGSTNGPATEGWQFHAEGLAWGAMALRRATPCELLAIDELGPLELLRDQGWRIGLDVLLAGGYQLALVSIRPSLLSSFCERLHVIKPLTLTVTEASRDALFTQILSLLGDDT